MDQQEDEWHQWTAIQIVAIAFQGQYINSKQMRLTDAKMGQKWERLPTMAVVQTQFWSADVAHIAIVEFCKQHCSSVFRQKHMDDIRICDFRNSASYFMSLEETALRFVVREVNSMNEVIHVDENPWVLDELKEFIMENVTKEAILTFDPSRRVFQNV